MVLTAADVRERWAEMAIYTDSPMRPRLSGLGVEYAILQVYSRDAGQRSAIISFNVGQGTQDIGFRNDIEVRLHGRAGASRAAARARRARSAGDRRISHSRRGGPDLPEHREAAGAGLLLPAAGLPRRRRDDCSCPAGAFTVDVSRGPEYLTQTQASDDLRAAGAARPAGALDRPGARRLVLGRSSHPFGGLLALRKPDRRRAAERHVAADRRRGAQRRERADVGAVLLPSEAVLQRPGSSAVEARRA